MNWSEISTALLDPVTGYLAQNWLTNDAKPLTPIVYDNVEDAPVQGEPWLRVSILPLGSLQLSEGNAPDTGVAKCIGQLWFNIVAPAGGGDAQAQTFADTLEAIFRNRIIGDTNSEIQFFDVKKMGQQTEGAWFYMTMQFGFYHYA